MNSAFAAPWLASTGGDYPSTIHLRAAEEKQNGFPFRFDFRKGNSFNERGGCTEKHKNGNKIFNGKLSLQPHIIRRKIKIQCLVHKNCRALKSKWKQWKQWNIWCFSAWFDFQQQEEFNSAIEELTPSNLTGACKSFICRQEGETGHFTIKNRLPLFGQPLIYTWEVHRWISLLPLSVRYLFNLCGIY